MVPVTGPAPQMELNWCEKAVKHDAGEKFFPSSMRRAGVMASRVAAHVGEVALGRPRAVEREAAMNAARKALDWEGMSRAALDPAQLAKRREAHKSEEVCAMCGKFCSVKMLRGH